MGNTGVVVVVVLLHAVYSVQGGSWTAWSKMGPCSVTCGAGVVWQKRSCIGDTPNPQCSGPQQKTSRCQKLACPVRSCNCGCVKTGRSGDIRSTSPTTGSKECRWTIKTTMNRKIKVTVTNFLPRYGSLHISSGRKVYKVVSKRATYPFTVVARERELNLTLLYHSPTMDKKGDDEVKLEASYEIIGVIPKVGINENGDPNPDNDNNDNDNSSKIAGLNIPTVAGISTCIIIIVIALCLIIYRRLFTTTKNKDVTDASDVDENCASLSSSSTRHGETSITKDTPKKPTTLNLDNKLNSGETQRLMGNQNNMFVRVNPTSGISPVFASSPNYMPMPQMAQMGQMGQMSPMGQMGPMPQMGQMAQMGQLGPPHMGQFGQMAFSPGHYTPDGSHVMTPEGHVAFVPTPNGTFMTTPQHYAQSH